MVPPRPASESLFSWFESIFLASVKDHVPGSNLNFYFSYISIPTAPLNPPSSQDICICSSYSGLRFEWTYPFSIACWILTPKGMLFTVGTFQAVIRLWRWSLTSAVRAFTREIREGFASTPGEHMVRRHHLGHRKWVLRRHRTNQCVVDLRLSCLPELWEISVCKLARLRDLVAEALVNEGARQ